MGLIIAFILGFIVHAWFFPDLFYNGLEAMRKKNIPVQEQSATATTENGQFFTYVTYKDGNFRPGVVTIKRSNYLAITNLNKNDLMWLVSDNKLLSTTRGYAESERLTSLLNETGTFTVLEKNKPNALLTVHVIK